MIILPTFPIPICVPLFSKYFSSLLSLAHFIFLIYESLLFTVTSICLGLSLFCDTSIVGGVIGCGSSIPVKFLEYIYVYPSSSSIYTFNLQSLLTVYSTLTSFPATISISSPFNNFVKWSLNNSKSIFSPIATFNFTILHTSFIAFIFTFLGLASSCFISIFIAFSFSVILFVSIFLKPASSSI